MLTIDSPPPAEARATAGGLESSAGAARAGTTGEADPKAAPSAAYFLRAGKAPVSILETVIGEDERARILETAAAPWRMICNLRFQGPLSAGVGTGWLVGPTTVLTAGHCVHDPRIGGWATQITVTPGLNRDRRPHGQVIARRFSSTQSWIADQNEDHDLGVIHLDADATPVDRDSAALGDALGFFGLAVRSDADLAGSFIHVAGYPGELARGFGKEMWGHRSRVTAVTERRVFYDVDTTAGQSGGPAFTIEDDPARPTAVAIHAYGTGGTPAHLGIIANSAPRITTEVFDMIERWIDSGAGRGR